MKPPMQYSGAGLALTENAEGCRLTAYQDVGGIWTNGYGNTHGVVPGSAITPEKAIADLRANIQTSVNDVNQLVAVQLTQGEFDALVDFDFNLGRGHLAHSTLLTDLNAGNFAAAGDQFEAWAKCKGVVVAGLLHRRVAEKTEFLTGDQA
jgi:lysozyme